MTTLIAFVFFGLFSPGPNVILLTASGARFGFRRTIPHVFGVAVGVGVTSGLTGVGIGALLTTLPALTFVSRILAAAWICYMAWQLWMSGGVAEKEAGAKPFTFLQAVLFQWVNPKVWAIALAATAHVTHLDPIGAGLALAATFSGVNLCVCLFWSFAGSLLSYLRDNPVAWRLFMRGMALALGASAVMVFL